MKINTKNEEKITNELAETQSRAKVRTVDYSAVQRAIKEVEKFLSTRLRKKDWVGLRVECNPNAQSFPGAYRGRPEATVFTVECFPSGWFMVSAFRQDCGSREYCIIGLENKKNELCEFAQEWRG